MHWFAGMSNYAILPIFLTCNAKSKYLALQKKKKLIMYKEIVSDFSLTFWSKASVKNF